VLYLLKLKLKNTMSLVLVFEMKFCSKMNRNLQLYITFSKINNFKHSVKKIFCNNIVKNKMYHLILTKIITLIILYNIKLGMKWKLPYLFFHIVMYIQFKWLLERKKKIIRRRRKKEKKT